ncbi:MAG: DUF1566 domain-containing protein [Candidatus Thiothrix putei]|uniref:DUF1566 domain-containing protein n=1 Tax=Candidatus Thiothrix putei TaxID=3080811 RepID=A0AA95HBM4_9GAMM|nr:MAG: DUF1566 domain-containing protein [Candidatus Thiothrix putei]
MASPQESVGRVAGLARKGNCPPLLSVLTLLSVLLLAGCDSGGGGATPAETSAGEGGMQSGGEIADSGVVPPSPSGKLNDTGITFCSDYAIDHSDNYNRDVACSLLSDADGDPVPPANRIDGAGKPTGQDGHVGRDVTHPDNSDGHAGFSFTKIGTNGRTLAIQDQLWSDWGSESMGLKWSCVKDNVTGLIWEVKQSTPDGRDAVDAHPYPLHDPDDTYTWNNAGAYVKQVNTKGWCGANDWRLPTINELESITDLGRSYPSLDMAYFPNTAFPSTAVSSSSPHWSATPSGATKAWKLYASFGVRMTDERSGSAYVRLVRSGHQVAAPQCIPDSDFTVHDDGTVTHKPTGLMWKRCLEGQPFSDNGTFDYQDDSCTGTVGAFNWSTALANSGSNFAGYADWRLPNIKELSSIVEFCREKPAINTSIFPGLSQQQVWSSSPDIRLQTSEGMSWVADFDNGKNSPMFSAKRIGVRLVRSTAP